MVDSEVQLKDFQVGHSRLITVHRTAKGFGFTLRHFVVYSELDSGTRISRSGQDAIRPNSEMMDTIFVKQVTDGGPAYLAGLRKGDRILAVNGQGVTGKSYSQVVALMQASDQSLKLVVEPKDGDMLQSKYESSAYASGDKPYSGKADDIPNPPKLSWRNSSGSVQNRLELSKDSPFDVEKNQVDTGLSLRKSSHMNLDGDKQNMDADNFLEPHVAAASRKSSSESNGCKDTTNTVKGGPPPVQSRTSSRNVLLKYPLTYPRPYMEIGQQRAGSLDSIYNPLAKLSVLGDPAKPGDMQEMSNKLINSPPELRGMVHSKSRIASWQNQTSEEDYQKKRFSTSEQRKRFFEGHSNSVNIPDNLCVHDNTGVSSFPSDVSVFKGRQDSESSQQHTAAQPLSRQDTALPWTLHPEHGDTSAVQSSSSASAVSSGYEKTTTTSITATSAQERSQHEPDDYGIAVSLNQISFLTDFNSSSKTMANPYSNNQSAKPTKEVLSDERSEVSVKQKRKLSLGDHAAHEYHGTSGLISGVTTASKTSSGGVEVTDLYLEHRSSWSKMSTSSTIPPHTSQGDPHQNLALSVDAMPYYLHKSPLEPRSQLIHQVLNQDDVDGKLARRTSYLMATRQRFSTEQESTTTTTEETALQRSEQTLDSTGKGHRQQKNIKKLKAFFGEKTPKIMDAHKSSDEPSSPLGDLIMEGQLNCKLAMTDGKKASDRSWKPMWALLRGHVLLLYKDKHSVNPLTFEELPISIKSSFIDIAYDYTKKKNVFRLTTYNGSEYLFQAEEHRTMLQWIQHIQENTNPDKDKTGVSKEELINRKIQQISSQDRSPLNYQPNQLKPKQKSTRALRSKSPAAYSPGLKQKRPPYKDDISESPKSSKTWKGKMVRKFRRSGSSSTSTIGEMSSQATFGVPLEYCPSSTFSEYIPFVVEVCTKMVEAKGLETQGIYRVPGNNGSVNLLQAEIDKGPDLVDMDNEKWLDVYVVGSLLKSFFRKLPEPLITEDLYDAIIQANRTDVQEKRMLKLKKVIHGLPEHHFETFHYLAKHLHNVIEKESENRMDARNIAIVFGPTLVRTMDDSMVTMVKDMSDQCRVIESIVSHPEWFFGSWDEDVYVPIDNEEPGMMCISGMNQTLIHKAENMQLGERGKEFSAKDLMSSVFSAANKKVRRRDKYKGTDSVDVELDSDVNYNERNIDAEIELRSKKQKEELEEQEKQSVQKSVVDSAEPSVHSHPPPSSDTSVVMLSTGDSRDNHPPLTTNSRAHLTNKALSSAESSDHKTSSSSTSIVLSTSSSQHKGQGVSSTDSSKVLTTAADTGSSAAAKELQAKTDGQSPAASRTTYNHTERAQRDLHTAKLAFMQQPPQPVSLGQHDIDKRQESLEKISSDQSQAELTLQVKRYPAYTAPDFRSFSTETSKPVIRYKYNSAAREITPPPRSIAVSQSRNYLPPSSKRLYSAGDAHRLQEQERRKQAKHCIEMELQKTKKELEDDDACLSDTLSQTSGYSSNSSYHGGSQQQPPYSYYHLGGGSSSVSPRYPASSGGGGSQGVLSTSASCGALRSGRGFYDDMDVSRLHNTYRETYGGQIAETEVDKSRSQSVVAAPPHTAASHDRELLGRHIGSLDSLLGRYEKVEQSQQQLYDSDSDQDDFLQKLTSTFDMKLQSLGGQYATVPRNANNNMPVPGQVILAQGNKQKFVPSSFVEKFRDPSLHRVTPPKGDPNIGIACRFERRDIDSVHSSSSQVRDYGGHRETATSHRDHREFRYPANLYEPSTTQPTNVVQPTDRHLVVSTDTAKSQGKSLGPYNTDTALKHKQPMMMIPHAKMSAAATLEVGGKSSDHTLLEKKENVLPGGRAVVYSGSQAGGLFESVDDSASSRYYTPAATITGRTTITGGATHNKKRNDRRRHTVGGSLDTEHYQALLTAISQQPPTAQKPPTSAWERLQPATRQQEPKDVQAWLKQQRGKYVKSTPSLVHVGATSDSPNFEFFKFDQFSPKENKRHRLSQRMSDSSEFSSPLSPPHDSSVQTQTRAFTFESSI